jgi:hypothetical protein
MGYVLHMGCSAGALDDRRNFRGPFVNIIEALKNVQFFGPVAAGLRLSLRAAAGGINPSRCAVIHPIDASQLTEQKRGGGGDTTETSHEQQEEGHCAGQLLLIGEGPDATADWHTGTIMHHASQITAPQRQRHQQVRGKPDPGYWLCLLLTASVPAGLVSPAVQCCLCSSRPCVSCIAVLPPFLSSAVLYLYNLHSHNTGV